tara:strand:- start:498 stop:605 length:108 start_codon:yes stop_codon:yes gene_type:complete
MKNKTSERQDKLNEALKKNLKRRKIQIKKNKLEKK